MFKILSVNYRIVFLIFRFQEVFKKQITTLVFFFNFLLLKNFLIFEIFQGYARICHFTTQLGVVYNNELLLSPIPNLSK